MLIKSSSMYFNMVLILILGDTDYIGLHLCQSLHRDPHQVYGVTRYGGKELLLVQDEEITILSTVEKLRYLKTVR